MVHRPRWFKDGQVFVSFAPTVGINKDGEDLFLVDSRTGTRTSMIDDRVREDVKHLLETGSRTTETSRWVPLEKFKPGLLAVPTYFDDRAARSFEDFMASREMNGFESVKLGDLIDAGDVRARHGHGSPSADLRAGTVPYIKVSDLRAGQVNINPTNRVSEVVARKFWRGESSELRPFSILTPIRTSKNIGDFAVLMPGQEQVVLTKEILVLDSGDQDEFDNFYLLWAMSLKVVREQWKRIVFMQTNREDVGLRYREIRVPRPPSRERADEVSSAFREYYRGVHELRKRFVTHLSETGEYHIFLATSVAEEIAEVDDSPSEGDAV